MRSDPNRPCPDCGTTDPAAFEWKLNKSRTNESRRTRCTCCHSKRMRKGTKKYRQEYSLEYRRGITGDQKELILKSQNGCCDLCGLKFYDNERIVVDHNHKTNQNRSLLHHRCNIGLSYIENEPFRGQAIAYLEKHSEK